jgi:hypothetical protein
MGGERPYKRKGEKENAMCRDEGGVYASSCVLEVEERRGRGGGDVGGSEAGTGKGTDRKRQGGLKR